MARLNVNPTRMELTKLKKRLMTARRGHKLLKDKRDELMKRFIEIIKENQKLRLKLENMATDASKSFVMAGALTSQESLAEALSYPSCKVDVQVSDRNIMGVTVPEFSYSIKEGSSEPYSYGFLNTSSELDNAVFKMHNMLSVLLELAGIEKAAQLLAVEIEHTRRRVNALEYLSLIHI